MPCSDQHFTPISFSTKHLALQFPPKRTWGGRRPGAGAPKGNLNAFRHGRYSTQQKDLARLLAQIPQARDSLIKLAKRRRKAEAQSNEGAAKLLAEILRRIGEIVIHPGACPEHCTGECGRDNHLENNKQLMATLANLEANLREISKSQSSHGPQQSS